MTGQTGRLDHLNAALSGRYSLVREIARGGMATVYLADDLRHRRQVALKVLQPELAAALGADRFAREIDIAAQLNHPHILALYDSGDANGELFYVMPYVAGASLRQRLDEHGVLPIDDAITIARQVASALDYAHGHRLVHRDIKPENILLHEGEAMVADFGIAIAPATPTNGRLTALGLTLGSPYYMSPEQAAGDPALDARSDVYSLACVLYEALAGEPPFTGKNAQAVMAKRFFEPAPGVRRLRPDVSVAVERALLRALSREPAERFASCGAFVAAFGRAVLPAAIETSLPSVAVLPFANLSTDPSNEFFADGITEDVIAQLSKIRALKVISRSSVMRYKSRDQDLREIGNALEVATVLEGSVRRASSRVRIVAQLVDVETSRHLWAETYDRELTDIFAIQSDVACHIASALEAELSPSERSRIHRKPTADLHAYQSYLKARFCYSRYTDEGHRQAIDYFREAIAADPSFALAHVGLAQTYAEMVISQGGGAMLPGEAYAHARSAVDMALSLDPELGEAHSVLALLTFVHDYEWVRAESEFKRALELSPGGADVHDYYGWLCGALERYDEALTLVRRAQELDPLTHRSDVASTLLRAGLYEEALETATQAVAFEPEYARTRATLAWAQLKMGRVADGLANLEYAVRLTPRNTMFLAQLGEAYGLYGRPDDAHAVLRQLEQLAQGRYVSPYHVAYVHTGLGDHERAMDCLEQAFAERGGNVYGIRGSFLFSSLRSHPRFKALLRKMNLA